jgi:hypothetical protein
MNTNCSTSSLADADLLSKITSGNAASDGEPFNHWFVGRLESWSQSNGVTYDPLSMGLRNSNLVEVKWVLHPRGERRKEWSEPAPKISLCILVSGHFVLNFRHPGNHGHELQRPMQYEGDYVCWDEAIPHTWWAEQDSRLVTVRWRAS